MSDFTTNLLATIRAKESQDNYDIFAGDKATANRGLTGRSINDDRYHIVTGKQIGRAHV